MRSFASIQDVVSELSFKGLTFEVGLEANQFIWLRVNDPTGTCNVNSEPAPWNGRKWRLSPHMTNGEIVQTAFKAVMTALEHEARETFKYRDAAVLGPHFDIDKWVEFLHTHEMELMRA
jgi:hypothetical protein